MKRKILRALARLERELGVHSIAENMNIYTRLQCVAELVLDRLEREYRVSPTPDQDLHARLSNLKGVAMQHLAQQIGLPPSFRTGSDLADLRTLYEHFTLLMFQKKDPRFLSPGDPLAKAFPRLQNWIAVSEGYLRDRFDTNRVVDLVFRMELEVFGKASIRGRRIASVRFGSPVSIHNYSDTPADTERLTLHLESNIQQLLDQSVY
jgi:hypothetical protein